MEKELNWEDLKVGDESGTIEYTITEAMVDRFAQAVDDHHDWYVKDSPFGGRIAPPPLTATDYQPTFVPKWGRIRGLHAKQETEFISPLRVGSKIRVSGTIVAKYEKRERKYLEFEYRIIDEDGNEAIRHKIITASR